MYPIELTTTTSDPSTYDVIVIGLGASGMTTLTSLAREGKYVLGLEAADRIGGRVYTYDCPGGKVELGAEWIHGTVSSEVYNIATANNISIVPQDLTFGVYRSDGEPGDVEVVAELMSMFVEMMEHPPDEPQPLGSYIKEELTKHLQKHKPTLAADKDFMAEMFEFLNLLSNNYEASNDWCDVTTASRYEELEGHQHVSWHRYGYRTLFHILANTYNNGPGLPNMQTKLNTPVSNIEWSTQPNKDVLVKCENGEEYKGKSVVVTVSLGVLKATHKTLFTPNLPPIKQTAIQNISMGVMDKVILFFDTPWWPKDFNFFAFIWKGENKAKVTSEDYWTTRIFGASRPMGCDTALTLWTSGEIGKKIETLPEDLVKTKCMELLRKFMGKNITIPEPTGIVRSKWFTNPYTRGSYTFDSVDSPKFRDARLQLSEPIFDTNMFPKLLFAGEATNEVHFSTVHGAIETGKRCVRTILGSKSKL